MVKILHNPSCSKSRCALDYLNEREIDYELVNIKKDGLTAEDISVVAKLLKMKAKDLVRTNEKLYKEELIDKKLTEKEWCQILAENPSLIQRPIVIKDNKAIIARPVESLKDFLK